ncbi:MAG: 3'-phosphoesterase [Candidatus Methylomirabilota bacterium]|nr:3'-phosphoesterase [candidate division NC10 bacterium]PWB48434.1 MAG: 3'-phosphoesterase [candidate division NC10 bacterium]
MSMPATSVMLRFVVHEHNATRLHYDFRLEMGGVLKSWAVPKGPSMNPADKRLAVMVADHPVDYIDFEGIIPEGHYGAGPVIVWDEGTYEMVESRSPEVQLDSGKLTILLKGRKLRGIFTLARFAGGETGREWLLMKKGDQYADQAWTLKSELTATRLKALAMKTPSCETS